MFLLHGLGDTCDGWSDMATKKMWGQNLPHVKFVLPTAPVVWNPNFDLEAKRQSRAVSVQSPGMAAFPLLRGMV